MKLTTITAALFAAAITLSSCGASKQTAADGVIVGGVKETKKQQVAAKRWKKYSIPEIKFEYNQLRNMFPYHVLQQRHVMSYHLYLLKFLEKLSFLQYLLVLFLILLILLFHLCHLFLVFLHPFFESLYLIFLPYYHLFG